jgi:hypothetical protein
VTNGEFFEKVARFRLVCKEFSERSRGAPRRGTSGRTGVFPVANKLDPDDRQPGEGPVRPSYLPATPGRSGVAEKIRR